MGKGRGSAAGAASGLVGLIVAGGAAYAVFVFVISAGGESPSDEEFQLPAKISVLAQDAAPESRHHGRGMSGRAFNDPGTDYSDADEPYIYTNDDFITGGNTDIANDVLCWMRQCRIKRKINKGPYVCHFSSSYNCDKGLPAPVPTEEYNRLLSVVDVTRGSDKKVRVRMWIKVSAASDAIIPLEIVFNKGANEGKGRKYGDWALTYSATDLYAGAGEFAVYFQVQNHSPGLNSLIFNQFSSGGNVTSAGASAMTLFPNGNAGVIQRSYSNTDPDAAHCWDDPQYPEWCPRDEHSYIKADVGDRYVRVLEATDEASLATPDRDECYDQDVSTWGYTGYSLFDFNSGDILYIRSYISLLYNGVDGGVQDCYLDFYGQYGDSMPTITPGSTIIADVQWADWGDKLLEDGMQIRINVPSDADVNTYDEQMYDYSSVSAYSSSCGFTVEIVADNTPVPIMEHMNIDTYTHTQAKDREDLGAWVDPDGTAVVGTYVTTGLSYGYSDLWGFPQSYDDVTYQTRTPYAVKDGTEFTANGGADRYVAKMTYGEKQLATVLPSLCNSINAAVIPTVPDPSTITSLPLPSHVGTPAPISVTGPADVAYGRTV